MAKAAITLSAATKAKVAALYTQTAQAYGGGTVGEYYSATPSVAQTLNEKIVQDGNPFLGMINIVPVSEVQGEKVLMELTSTITGRTQIVGSAERVARDVSGTDADPYQLYATESDTAIPYATIDAWAKFPNFAQLYGQMVRKAIGNDRLRIGWYGESAAATTDRGANPNLEDVNIGWLQQIKDWNSGSQWVEGTVGTPIEMGSTEIPNLDVLAYSALDMLDEPFRSDPGLMVLLSRNLLSAAEGKYFAAYGNRPTEKMEIQSGFVTKTYGGMPAMVPAFFPDNTLLVTTLKNLSIYYQDTSWRRMQRDYAPKNRYEDFNSRNEGYVIQQHEKCALITGITLAAVSAPALP